MHHDEARDALRRKHHHGDEHQAEVELPDFREIGQHHLQVADENGPDHRPEERSGAADERREQHIARLHRREQGRVGDLEVDGREPARDAGEEARQAEGEEAHDLGIVADELHALGVVAGRIAHAAERGARDLVHEVHAQEAPEGDQVVDLDLRPEIPVEDAQELGAVRRHALLAAEEPAQDQRRGSHELCEPERDHGERRAGALRRDPSEQHAEEEAG